MSSSDATNNSSSSPSSSSVNNSNENGRDSRVNLENFIDVEYYGRKEEEHVLERFQREYEGKEMYIKSAKIIFINGMDYEKLKRNVLNYIEHVEAKGTADDEYSLKPYFGKILEKIKNIYPYKLLGKDDGTIEPNDFEIVTDKTCCCGVIKYKYHQFVDNPLQKISRLSLDEFRLLTLKKLVLMDSNRMYLMRKSCSANIEGAMLSTLFFMILIPYLSMFFNSLYLYNKTGFTDIYYEFTFRKSGLLAGSIMLFYLFFFLKLCTLSTKNNYIYSLLFATISILAAASYCFQLASEGIFLSEKPLYRAVVYKKAFERNITSSDRFIISMQQKSFQCCGVKGYSDYNASNIPEECFKNRLQYVKYIKNKDKANLKVLCRPKGCYELISSKKADVSSLSVVALNVSIFLILILRAPFVLSIKRNELIKDFLITEHLREREGKNRENDLIYFHNMDKHFNDSFLKTKLDIYILKYKKALNIAKKYKF